MGDLRSRCSVLSLETLNTEQAELVQCQGNWDAPLGYAHLVKKHCFLFSPPTPPEIQLVLGLAAIQSQGVDVFYKTDLNSRQINFPDLNKVFYTPTGHQKAHLKSLVSLICLISASRRVRLE